MNETGHVWAVVPDAIWDGVVKFVQRAVIVEGDRIADVVEISKLGNIPRKELPGCTLIPGLIDAHVHLSRWMMPAFLAAGVTTVRDVGNDLEWVLKQREATFQNPLVGPTIFCCGPVLDGPVVNWTGISRGHQDETEIAQSVQNLFDSGVDAIKLYVNLTKDQITSATAAAHRLGLYVLAHLGEVNALDASGLGVDEIEHLSGCIHHEHGGMSPYTDPEYLTRCIDTFLKNHTAMCPTLVVWDRLSRINDGAFPNDRRLEWVHPTLKTAWSQFPHRFLDPKIRLHRQLSLITMKNSLREMWLSGCLIVAGTDTPWPYVVPGFGLHDELALTVDAGVSPTEALKMATVNAAAALGLDGEVGIIAAGAVANLVAVEGDPTEDITDLSNVQWVSHRGQSIQREKLVAQRDVEFENEPNDATTELILGVARTQILPISPETRFTGN